MICSGFQKIWIDFQSIKVNEKLIQGTSDLIERHNLRGYDAVHLASALLLKVETKIPNFIFLVLTEILTGLQKRKILNTRILILL